MRWESVGLQIEFTYDKRKFLFGDVILSSLV